MHQFRQYVIMTIVLLGCVASVFFGIRQIVSEPSYDVAPYSAIAGEGYKIPRYKGPALYHASAGQSGGTITMAMGSTSSRALFHHNAGAAGYGRVAANRDVSYTHGAYAPVYRTSNSTLRSIGGGGSGGGYASGSGYSVSGGVSGGGSVSVPSLGLSLPRIRTYAYNKGVAASDIETMSVRNAKPGIKRAAPEREGDEAEYYWDGKDMWFWDGEEWVEEETIKIEDGKVYRWDSDSNSWVFVSDQAGPDSPIGDIPWILFLLMLAGYTICRKLKNKKEVIIKAIKQ